LSEISEKKLKQGTRRKTSNNTSNKLPVSP